MEGSWLSGSAAQCRKGSDMKWLFLVIPLLSGCSAMENAMVDNFIDSAIRGGESFKNNEAKILTHATKAIGVGALLRMEPGATKCGVWLIGGGSTTDSPCAGVVAPNTGVIVVSQGPDGQPRVMQVQPQIAVPEAPLESFDPDSEPVVP